ncbi:hypothetical protein KIN20_023647 [Parelaphostrongylus tenuis]|uniref:Uncharacterized protein n=1 Tax=Parelaphostrongylus tenuis TaxID=148309 RepID=A0AAD5MS84_PARTN|nr:hypothetical protein KIN20_023647 [Parelaphostrongylus tenuis]
MRNSDDVAIPALHELGSMSMGSDNLTQYLVDLEILSEIIPLIERSKSTTVVKECCRLISKIIAGTQWQIQAVIDAGIMPSILKVLDLGDLKCHFESSWAAANLALGNAAKQVLCLLEENAFPILCPALAHSNLDLLINILEFFHTLLNVVSSW